MWLKQGPHSLLVTPQGGSILQWQSEEHFILGPARDVRVSPDKITRRGESHWCFPNWGTPPPKFAAAQPKHGQLRHIHLPYTVSREDTTAIFGHLNLDPKIHAPAWDVTAQIRYFVGTEGVHASLRAFNFGKTSTPVLPAFHPYFAVPKDGFWASMNHVAIARAVPKSDNFWNVSSEAQVIERTGDIAIELGGICRIALDLPNNCTHIAIWSDNPESYVCVEPIFGQPGTFGKPEGRWLEPGGCIECKIYMDCDRVLR